MSLAISLHINDGTSHAITNQLRLDRFGALDGEFHIVMLTTRSLMGGGGICIP